MDHKHILNISTGPNYFPNSFNGPIHNEIYIERRLDFQNKHIQKHKGIHVASQINPYIYSM